MAAGAAGRVQTSGLSNPSGGGIAGLGPSQRGFGKSTRSALMRARCTVAKAFSVGRRVQKRRIGVSRHQTLPKLFRGDEAGADKFAPAPDQRTYPKDFAARCECQAEKVRHRQRADIQASAVVGDIDDQALDPWRLGRRNQKSRLVQIDPNLFAAAAVPALSCHLIPLGPKPRQKYLNTSYR